MKKKVLAMMCVLGMASVMFTGCGGSSDTSSDSPEQDAEAQDDASDAADDADAATGNEIEGEYTFEDANGVSWDLLITETHFDLTGTKVNENGDTVEVVYSGPGVMNDEGTDHSGKLVDPLYLFMLGSPDVKVNGEYQAAGDELYDKIIGVTSDENYAKPKIQVDLDVDNGTFSLTNSDEDLHVGLYWE